MALIKAGLAPFPDAIEAVVEACPPALQLAGPGFMAEGSLVSCASVEAALEAVAADVPSMRNPVPAGIPVLDPAPACAPLMPRAIASLVSLRQAGASEQEQEHRNSKGFSGFHGFHRAVSSAWWQS